MLVWDEGVLDILVKARAAGHVPEDSSFKVSVYTGHANPASSASSSSLGADSLNPVGDLSRPMLGAIRQAVKLPLDVWAITFDSFGGMNRLWEAGEIAAVAAPVYFKVEPGDSEGAMYVSWAEPTAQDAAIRKQTPPRQDPVRAGRADEPGDPGVGPSGALEVNSTLSG